MSAPVAFRALPGLPEVEPGADLAQLIREALRAAAIELQPGDVLVIAQKIVSKAEARQRRLADVTPSTAAVELAGDVPGGVTTVAAQTAGGAAGANTFSSGSFTLTGSKGSATINGTSLTVNTVVDTPDGAVISINLIPHTISVTTLRLLKTGDRVNVEVDLIARYVERMLGAK